MTGADACVCQGDEGFESHWHWHAMHGSVNMPGSGATPDQREELNRYEDQAVRDEMERAKTGLDSLQVSSRSVCQCCASVLKPG